MHFANVIFVLVVVSVTGNLAYPSDSDMALDDSCVCTLEYRPVCGSDGKTYANPCTFRCEQQTDPGLHQSCEGECPCKLVAFDSQPRNLDDSCVCPAVYQPVCGSDGRTYSNGCFLACEQEKNSELHQECKRECPCEPVANDASFDQEPRTCLCPRIYDPVCASNGRTYPNRCEFECVQTDNPDINIVHSGPC